MFVITIISLVLGLFYLEFGAFLVILYGFFHFDKNKDNIEKSPDWIISRRFFNIDGVPIWMHKIIGIIMIGFSLYWINSIIDKKTDTDTYAKLYPIFNKIVLSVIILELVLKKIILGKEK